MFTLIATTNKSEGILNIPVRNRMTNEDVAEAIFKHLTPQNGVQIAKRIDEVTKYVKTLRNEHEKLFIDPCYDVCEDEFILSFGFTND